MAPRTPLLRPDRYFAARDPDAGRGLLVAVLVVVAGLALVRALVGLLAAKIDGTVMVDNSDRPPEGFCTGGGDGSFTGAGFDCSAPAEVERNIDALLRTAAGELYAPMLVGLVVVLVGTAVLLHFGTALAGGEGSFANTLTVTAWGFAPTLATMPLALAALWLLMDPITVSSATDPEALQRAVVDSFRPWLSVAFAFNLVGSAWGAAVWTFGLERGRSVSLTAAATAAVVVTGLLLFGAVV